MLAQRLRRWPNIKTLLFQRVVFAGWLTYAGHGLHGLHAGVAVHITGSHSWLSHLAGLVRI